MKFPFWRSTDVKETDKSRWAKPEHGTGLCLCTKSRVKGKTSQAFYHFRRRSGFRVVLELRLRRT